MAYPKVYQWTPPDNAAITASAAYTVGAMPLNGTLRNQAAPLSINFPGFSRVVSVTSNANLTPVNFTINGFYNGQPVQSIITGVNINTVQGTQLFDYVTSVTTSSNISNASVGIGQTGHTNWYLADYNKSMSNFSFQAIATATITYSLIATLQDVTTTTALSQLNFSDPTAGSMTAKTVTTQGASSLTPYRYICFQITASNATGALTGIILESG